ncbi:hypothetical protein ACFOLJ_00020 [Rugamonas sp. CCM 8940]|uniref:hypothetical protein n=1 Tax=Rugamonas sp. CCM 8940 TaxID=2765359 RepID=UPI003612F6A6
MLQVHSLAQRSTHAYVQVEAQLQHQSQILDQIHESVLTMDLSGFITSWNKGAEKLFATAPWKPSAATSSSCTRTRT